MALSSPQARSTVAINSAVGGLAETGAALDYRIRRLQDRIARARAEPLRRFRLREEMAAALGVVDGAPGLSQMELARALDIYKERACRLVDELEAADLVVRQSLPEDRRRHALQLTIHGREVLEAMRACDRTNEAAVRAALGEPEMVRFLEALDKAYSAFTGEPG